MKPHDAPDNDQPNSQRPETDDDGLIRLQKLLAQSGVASRRKCEELMLDGLVEVDGEIVSRLGTKVDPRTAVIRVDGKRLPPVSAHVYLVLNKPRGVVSTMSDPEGRRTLSDFVGDRPASAWFHRGAAAVVFDFEVADGKVRAITFRAEPAVLEQVVRREGPEVR